VSETIFMARSADRAANGGAIPVLLYHSVPAAEPPDDPLSVSKARFGSHLDAICDSGRVPVSIEALAEGLRGERDLPERPMAVTFDDAYEDTVEAVDRLNERGIPASVYVTTGQIGTGEMLRCDQLAQLASRGEGVELGAHTVNHPYLDELDLERVREEVTASKSRLEELVGREIGTFAYPYGAYDRRVREAVIDAGFRSAASVKNAISHRCDDPWAIARWTVGRTTTAEEIARILAGAGAPPAWQHVRLRTRGYRIARRARRRIVERLGGAR
jgi:peptidoglycan/xylan/chitin deacetylase (PgdA/CDA1 family)